MKLNWLTLLFVIGCKSSKLEEEIDLPIPPPPSLPKHFLIPTTPPNFTPNVEEVFEIQINPIPHPLNVNGNIPYVVWLNGEKLILSPKQVRELAYSLNIEYKQPEDTAEIHNGQGWLRPFSKKELAIINESK